MSDSIGMIMGGLIVVLPVAFFMWIQVRDRGESESD